MTQHNISGSEADRPCAHVQVAHGRRRGAPLPWRGFAAVTAIGAGAGLVDAVVGAPVLLPLIIAGAVTLLIWDR